MNEGRPILLDLFCCEGGCSMGYYRAGFDVVGVDCRPMSRYPFRFVQEDALEFLRRHGAEFDAIHASPPCQGFSVTKNMGWGKDHPNLINPTRELLEATGKPWVIENVPGAPLRFPILICGLALGLGVKRHRLFESNVFLFGTGCPPGHRGNYLNVSGHPVGEQRRGWVTVCGGGAPAVADQRRRANVALARVAMGIDWMSRDGLSQAIPPAYTEHVGKQLMQWIQSRTERTC